ncbi:MAG: hypothetical protein GY699_23720, partial [Desulfobacteraceae bacterium]|nr:hypothetical protein [Desulfobacteraceae bacterium]
DVLGSLIDWNNDDHNCPDYPTNCDEWDDEAGQCGCGDDGIDPPSEPGIYRRAFNRLLHITTCI